MSQKPWTTQAIPDQTGRVAIVTGATSGTGYETARILAAKGATVILACRNAEKTAEAIAFPRPGVSLGRRSVAGCNDRLWARVMGRHSNNCHDQKSCEHQLLPDF